MKKLSVFLLFILFLIGKINAQTSEIIKEINEQVYERFTLAYEHKDVELFRKIQHDDLIRVSGDSKKISSKSEYLMGIGNWWAHSEDQLTIEFRFYERINSESLASEIGVYRIKIENPSQPTRYSYGEFHVILTKRTGEWKFLVDYDSSKNGTVGEKQFKEARDMNDF
jgi:ketosteroid isomerase-like protein